MLSRNPHLHRVARSRPWFWPVLRTLAGLRSLRGSWLDPFRFGPERAVDRSLLANYEADLDLIAKTRGIPEEALKLAAWPAAVWLKFCPKMPKSFPGMKTRWWTSAFIAAWPKAGASCAPMRPNF